MARRKTSPQDEPVVTSWIVSDTTEEIRRAPRNNISMEVPSYLIDALATSFEADATKEIAVPTVEQAKRVRTLLNAAAAKLDIGVALRYIGTDGVQSSVLAKDAPDEAYRVLFKGKVRKHRKVADQPLVEEGFEQAS